MDSGSVAGPSDPRGGGALPGAGEPPRPLPPPPPSPEAPRAGLGPLLLALALGAAATFAGLGAPALFDPDEGRYASIAVSFLRTGDWVVPHIDGVPFHDKPPGVLWLVGLAFAALGPTPGAARLVPAMAGVAGLVVAAALAWGLTRDRRAAALAALSLAAAPLWLGGSRFLVLDVPLATLVAAGFGLVAHGAGCFDGRWRWWARLAGGVVLGLGVLAKGPVAVGLAGLGALAAAAVERDRRHALRLLEPTPWLVAIVVAAPWYVAFGLRNPAGLVDFLVTENLRRFAHFDQHRRSAGIYPLTLAWGLGPALLLWAPWAVGAARAAVRARGWRGLGAAPAPEGRGARTLGAFAAATLAFFCAASAKLETYLLPMFPPLAALLGAWLARAADDPARAAALRRPALLTAGAVAAAPALLLAAGAAAGGVTKDTLVAAAPYVPWAALLAVPGALVAAWTLREARGCALAGLPGRVLVAWTLATVAAVPLVVGVAEARTAAGLAAAIAARRTPEHAVVCYGGFVRGLPYYLGDGVVVALTASEFPAEMFTRHRPELFLADDAAVHHFLVQRRPTLLVVQGDGDSWREASLADAIRAVPGATLVDRGRHGRFTLYEVWSPPPDGSAPSSP